MINLADKAKEAAEKAYCPYSKYKVGAALLTKSGKIYMGCNIENASFGLTICAERVAVFNAVHEGEKEFEAIAIFTGSEIATPCGACLQVLAEFAPNIKIILSSTTKREEMSLRDLIPRPFTL